MTEFKKQVLSVIDELDKISKDGTLQLSKEQFIALKKWLFVVSESFDDKGENHEN